MEELELTYLAKELPLNLSSYPSKEMLDIYIPSTATHPHLRIRKRGEVYEMTKKDPVVGNDSSRQLEQTIPLTRQEYDELSMVKGKRVTKHRFEYEEAGITYEIDIFGGMLSGLVLVDVEFKTFEEQKAFAMPSFCLVDVTQEHFTAGGMLCGKSYSDIQHDLDRFGYKKLTLT